MLPIFIVSLANSARRYEISNQLKGFSYEFIDAVYGKNFIEDLNLINESSWVKNRYQRKLSPGELGCALSHRKIYKKIIDEKIQWAIILEDDIKSKINFQKTINNNINILNPKNLYILGCQEGLPAFDHVVLSKRNIIKFQDITFRKLIKSERYIYRTAAYLISYEVAKNILEFTEDKFCLADDWDKFYKEKLFNEIYLSDIVSHPADFHLQSTIESERAVKDSYQIFRVLKIFNILRKFKMYLRHFILGKFYD